MTDTTSRVAAAQALSDLVGAVMPFEGRPHVERASVDCIRNFARAYGDDNPLFNDPEYAQQSAAGRVFAPPLFPIATGGPDLDQRPSTAVGDHLRILGNGKQRMVDDSWALHRPITLDMRLQRVDYLASVHWNDDASDVRVQVRSEYTDGDVQIASRTRERRYLVATPHRTTAPAPATYTPTQLAEVALAYEKEHRRGEQTRTADEVAIGDVLGPMVKGPMTVTDLVNYRSGVGAGPLGAESNLLGYRNAASRPDVYDRNRQSVLETRERCHWDEAYAATQGHPTAYDYSHMRPVWLAHLLTNWMGDGGWLSRIHTTLDGFNYVGDLHQLAGVVQAVDLGPSQGTIGIALRATNQRGDVTCHGSAEVLLPRRGWGTAIPEDAPTR